jgi:O-acetyl-ADP-ribose deacetylase (regulator of RNase III)
MIKFTVGNILESDAYALVNTVNCEGFMGKGIAYQFKQAYPDNNADYVRACKSGQLRIGKLHHYEENGKLIINFPTKDKWRAPSKMEYLESGLSELRALIKDKEIKSISLPPLGSGNGGLDWNKVKPVVMRYLDGLGDVCDILIYEPSQNYGAAPIREPKLSASALVLMRIEQELIRSGKRPSKLRVQKTAYLTDIFAKKDHFKFSRGDYGPYAQSIEVIQRKIDGFCQYHGADASEAFNIAMSKLISDSVKKTLCGLDPHIMHAAEYVNEIKEDHELECLSTVLFILQEKGPLEPKDTIQEFKNWSFAKAEKFSNDDIERSIASLREKGIIVRALYGCEISPKYQKKDPHNKK